MTKLKALLPVTLLALAATGCSSGTDGATADEAPTEADNTTAPAEDAPATTYGHGEYALMTEYGAEVRFTLPTTDHEIVEAFDQWREDAGAEPVTYLIAEVDNRHGELQVPLPQVKVFDEDGNTYEFTSLGLTSDEWRPQRDWETDEFTLIDGTPTDLDTYNELRDRKAELNDLIDSEVDIAATGTMGLVYVGDDLPEEFTRVSAAPHGIAGNQDAHPLPDEATE